MRLGHTCEPTACSPPVAHGSVQTAASALHVRVLLVGMHSCLVVAREEQGEGDNVAILEDRFHQLDNRHMGSCGVGFAV